MNHKAAEHTQKALTCFFWIHKLTEASGLFTVILIDRDRAMMSFSFRAHHASFASSQRFVSGLGSQEIGARNSSPLNMKVRPQRLTTSINPGAYLAWQVAQVVCLRHLFIYPLSVLTPGMESLAVLDRQTVRRRRNVLGLDGEIDSQYTLC